MCTQYYELGPAVAEHTGDCLRAFYQGLPNGFIDYAIQFVANGEEEVRKAVSAFADAGCDEVLLMSTTDDPAEVDRLADVLAQDGVSGFCPEPSGRRLPVRSLGNDWTTKVNGPNKGAASSGARSRDINLTEPAGNGLNRLTPAFSGQ